MTIHTKIKKREYKGLLFLLPSFLGVGLFWVIPYGDVIRRSFFSAVSSEFTGLKNYQTVFENQAFRLAAANTLRFFCICIPGDVIRRSFFSAVSSEFTGLKNYQTVFENQAFRLAAANTLRFFCICIPALVTLSLLIAVLLTRRKKGMHILKSMFLLPMAIPVASVVLLWKVLFHSQGLLNHLLELLNFQGPDWMNTDASFFVLVVSYLWRNLGYDIVLWVAGLGAIPASLYEAARVDGAGEWKCFVKITLPNLLPSLFTIVVLSLLNASLYEAARVDGAGEWKCFVKITLPNLLPSLFTIVVLSLLNGFKVFREAWLVAGDYPQNSMYLLQHLFNNWYRDINNWYRDMSFDKMAAAAVVTGSVILVLILLLQKAWEGGDSI